MPVIKVTLTAKVFKKEQKDKLTEELVKELKGEATQQPPVIFEIPLGDSDKFDVLVIWKAWEEVPSEIRSGIILEAYGDQKTKISQALGMTYKEAMEQHVLPYAVVPLIRKGEEDADKLKTAMLKHGGIALEDGKIDLRYPTMMMAEQHHRQLVDELPKGYWSIVQSVNPLY